VKVIVNIIKYIVLVILVISLIATVILNIATSTILDKEYILAKLEETNYYDSLHTEVISNFENYIYQSGLDESVLQDLVTVEEVKEDTIQIINNLYSKEVKKVDINKIESRLQKNIDESLKGHHITNTNKTAIKLFIGEITEEYENTILNIEGEEKINKILTKVIEYANKAKTMLLIVDIVLIILLMLLSIKRLSRGLANVGVAILGSGIFNIVLNAIVNANVRINYITILSTGFSMTVRNILNDIMDTVMSNGIILAVVGLIIVIIGNIINSRNEKETSTEK